MDHLISTLRDAVDLEKNWIAFLYGAMGVLLILFPVQLTNAVPYMLGFGLIARGIIGAVVVLKYGHASNVKVGWILIDIVLGIAILYHNSASLGAIGAIWAMMSLYEVAEELSDSYARRDFSVIRMIFSAITVALAVMLMFNPFQHFVFHVRILGLEMLSTVFARRHKLGPD